MSKYLIIILVICSFITSVSGFILYKKSERIVNLNQIDTLSNYLIIQLNNKIELFDQLSNEENQRIKSDFEEHISEFNKLTDADNNVLKELGVLFIEDYEKVVIILESNNIDIERNIANYNLKNLNKSYTNLQLYLGKT